MTTSLAGGLYTMRAGAPANVIVGKMTPDNDGGYDFVGVMSPSVRVDVGAVFPDASVPSADAAPDAGFTVDATPALDASNAAFGRYEPPVTGTEPGGAGLTKTTLALPAVGATVTDPNFPGVKVKRLLASGQHDYSQLSPFSHGNAYWLLSVNGSYGIYNSTGVVASSLDLGGPRWLRGTTSIAHFVGQPLRVMVYDAVTRSQRTAITTSWPFGAVGNVFEEASDDGRLLVGMGYQSGRVQLTIFVADLAAGALRAQISIDQLYSSACTRDPQWGLIEPDFVRISPSGKYIVVQWPGDSAGRCKGMELFDSATGAYVRRVHDHHNHGDFGTTPAGDEVYVTSALASRLNNNYPAVVMEYLDGRPPIELRLMPWGALEHVSCLSLAKTGYCLVTASNGVASFLGELWLVYLDGSARRLWHHRSSAADYWKQPRAGVSPSGGKAIFDSDWSAGGSAAPYMLEW